MRILAFGAHPDDVEIGMGGTIARFSREHDVKIAVIIVPDDVETRKKEAKRSASVLNVDLEIVDYPKERVLLNRDFVDMITNVIAGFNPDVVYTQWINDSHQDHHILTQAVVAATRRNSMDVIMYEPTKAIVPFAFNPQLYYDISSTIDLKNKALSCFKSQLERRGHHFESVEGRARYWGYRINKAYAEAFEIIKIIH